MKFITTLLFLGVVLEVEADTIGLLFREILPTTLPTTVGTNSETNGGNGLVSEIKLTSSDFGVNLKCEQTSYTEKDQCWFAIPGTDSKPDYMSWGGANEQTSFQTEQPDEYKNMFVCGVRVAKHHKTEWVGTQRNDGVAGLWLKYCRLFDWTNTQSSWQTLKWLEPGTLSSDNSDYEVVGHVCDTDTFVTGFGMQFRPHQNGNYDQTILSNAGVLSLATRCSKMNDASTARWFQLNEHTTTETYPSDQWYDFYYSDSMAICGARVSAGTDASNTNTEYTDYTGVGNIRFKFCHTSLVYLSSSSNNVISFANLESDVTHTSTIILGNMLAKLTTSDAAALSQVVISQLDTTGTKNIDNVIVSGEADFISTDAAGGLSVNFEKIPAFEISKQYMLTSITNTGRNSIANYHPTVAKNLLYICIPPYFKTAMPAMKIVATFHTTTSTIDYVYSKGGTQVTSQTGVSYVDFEALTFFQDYPAIKYAAKDATWTATNVDVGVAGGEAELVSTVVTASNRITFTKMKKVIGALSSEQMMMSDTYKVLLKTSLKSQTVDGIDYSSSAWQSCYHYTEISFEIVSSIAYDSISGKCDNQHQFCTNEVFDPTFEAVLFEGSIALYQAGMLYIKHETRSDYQAALTCPSTITPSNLVIQQKLLLPNSENDHDGNTCPQGYTNYVNPNRQGKSHSAFYGGVIKFPTCLYIYNFAEVQGDDSQRAYSSERLTISVEYETITDPAATQGKITKTLIDSSKIWGPNAKLAYEDFSCSPTALKYHPGLNAIFYFLSQDPSTYIIKGVLGYAGTDPCKAGQAIHEGATGAYRFKIDLDSLTSNSGTPSSLQTSTLAFRTDEAIFLNNIMYIPANVKTISGTELTAIYKIDMTITSATSAPTTQLSYVGQASGKILQIAVFELNGFVYTIEAQNGYYLSKMDFTTFKFTTTTRFLSTVTWKIYQTDGGNHMHRPIFGVPVSTPSKIYRITSTPEFFMEDSAGLSDFYNYEIQFGRYRAISLQPGSLTDPIAALDFSKMKIIVLNLRLKTVESRIPISQPGCGDGLLDKSLGETCDDGNNVSGDGCDSNCNVETNWECTAVEGALSVCTYIACGDGNLDAGEECDIGASASATAESRAACVSCVIQAGYSCARSGNGATSATPDVCTHMCGDGKVFKQYKTDSAGTQTLFYEEPCDLGPTAQDAAGVNVGCSSSCAVLPGWACTTSASAPFISTCAPTCGDKTKSADEACDIGNSQISSVVYDDTQTNKIRVTANSAYDSSISSAGCSADCTAITAGYRCPATAVGPCVSSDCGNGYYEGVFTAVGRTTSLVAYEEQCDDGNEVDGDGCSAMCLLEDPTGTLSGTSWTCQHVFVDLVYEVPRFRTQCTAVSRRLLADEVVFNETSSILTQNLVRVPHFVDQTTSEIKFIAGMHPTTGNADQVSFRLFDIASGQMETRLLDLNQNVSLTHATDLLKLKWPLYNVDVKQSKLNSFTILLETMQDLPNTTIPYELKFDVRQVECDPIFYEEKALILARKSNIEGIVVQIYHYNQTEQRYVPIKDVMRIDDEIQENVCDMVVKLEDTEYVFIKTPLSFYADFIDLKKESHKKLPFAFTGPMARSALKKISLLKTHTSEMMAYTITPYPALYGLKFNTTAEELQQTWALTLPSGQFLARDLLLSTPREHFSRSHQYITALENQRVALLSKQDCAGTYLSDKAYFDASEQVAKSLLILDIQQREFVKCIDLENVQALAAPEDVTKKEITYSQNVDEKLQFVN